MKFVGRQRELDTLERLYGAPGFQMPVVYGRRRVGKTSLINQFVEGKRAIFFSARESTAKENLVALSKAIAEFAESGNFGSFELTDKPVAVFPAFEDAFSYVFSLASQQRLVFVIDEYPYLAQSDKSVSSVLQHLIDKNREASNLFLILCGSSMSFMEHQVLGYKSPLYGRRTAQIKVEPFGFREACQLLSGASVEDNVAWYGIAGGVPLYLEQFDTGLSVEQNIAQNVLGIDSFLFGEPDAFLQQEMREPAKYKAIIQTIAGGEGKLTNIADGAGIERTAATSYLKSLIELGIIRREEPMVDASRKKVRYVVSDPLFRFWYRFVPQYLTPLQVGREREVAQLIVREHLATYTGPVFEEVCRQWLLEESMRDDVPFILNVGRWWGTDPVRKAQAEIDVVAQCDDGTLICGECKWQSKPVGDDVLRTLQHRASLIQHGQPLQLLLFSKAGFTEECRAEAQKAGCRLVTLEDMW